jgi:putative flippase GtrA
LVWTSLMSSSWVFKSKSSLGPILAFSAMHTVLFLIGQLLIWIVSPQSFYERLALSVLIVGVSAPISFFMGRFTFARARGNVITQNGQLRRYL